MTRAHKCCQCGEECDCYESWLDNCIGCSACGKADNDSKMSDGQDGDCEDEEQ